MRHINWIVKSQLVKVSDISDNDWKRKLRQKHLSIWQRIWKYKINSIDFS